MNENEKTTPYIWSLWERSYLQQQQGTKKAKEERMNLHFPYVKTKENTTELDIFNLSKF